jgi:hypothetical protein
VAAGVRQASGGAEDTRGGGVQFGLEAELFGRLGEVLVQPENVVNGLAALRIAPDVLRPVVTVSDDVNVQPTTTTGATFADLYDRVDRAAKAAGDGSEQGAHGGVVQAGGVI